MCVVEMPTGKQETDCVQSVIPTSVNLLGGGAKVEGINAIESTQTQSMRPREGRDEEIEEREDGGSVEWERRVGGSPLTNRTRRPLGLRSVPTEVNSGSIELSEGLTVSGICRA